MICIIKQTDNGEITGWLTACDVHEARRKAQNAWDQQLATALYIGPEFPSLGRHDLGKLDGVKNYIMLVD